MTQVTRVKPLLTAMHQYDKSLSTRNRGRGTLIKAPILAYLIETPNGRILFDVGCDFKKINDPALRTQYYGFDDFPFGAPEMESSQTVSAHLEKLKLTPKDIDVVFISHLHFDHAGGLCELCGCEVHVNKHEIIAARSGQDPAVFSDEIQSQIGWKAVNGDYELVPGIHAIFTPGHTAGHMSLYIERPKGKPIILCGDAADLEENIRDEIAPGLCWDNDELKAIRSIRKLKAVAKDTHAELWPNHDLHFWKQLIRSEHLPHKKSGGIPA